MTTSPLDEPAPDHDASQHHPSGLASALAEAGGRGSSDALFAIEQFGVWIRNADTKASLLATALTLLVGAAVNQFVGARDSFPPSSVWQWAALGSAAAAFLAVIAAGIFLIGVLAPRTITGNFSRYSWPSVAHSTIDALVQLDHRTDRAEAWYTARLLARIAEVKIKAFRMALRWTVVATVAFIIWPFLYGM